MRYINISKLEDYSGHVEDSTVPQMLAQLAPCGLPATGKKSLNSGGSSSSV